MNKQPTKRGTFIHGVAASEHLDSSGERILVDGMDISSLERGEGLLNWEHKSENASHIVGKILKAKKIFKAEDCEDQNQLYFWNKGKAPFVYIVGELFDGVGHQQAKEVSAMLKYDALNRSEGNPSQKNVINFSVEGAKLEKKGTDITKSIARKVTITVIPCNKAALAEEYPAVQKPASSSPLEGMFKTEEADSVYVLEKYDPTHKLGAPGTGTLHAMPKPAAPKMPAAPQAPNHGSKIGSTKSGKDIMSHKKTSEYQDFTSQDHADAANAHYNAAQAAKTPKEGSHHMNQVKFHQARGQTLSSVKDRNKAQFDVTQHTGIKKALTAGSGMCAPSAKTGGEALSKEKMVKKLKKAADEAFQNWPRGQEFVEHLVKKLPHLSKAEALAFAKLMALKTVQKAEANLNKMSGSKPEPLMKPYVSDQQRKWAHTKAGMEALGGKKAVAEWDRATKGKKLPKRAKKSKA